jgi:hypothetical protein
MKYEDMLKQIQAESCELAGHTRRLGWELPRTTPTAIKRTVAARIEKMKADNEPFRRLPRSEHERVRVEIEREETAARQLAAGVARFAVEPKVRELDRKYQAFIARRRHDAELSFRDALDRVTADGMIMLAVLRESLRPTIDKADPAALLQRYARAVETRDAKGRIEAELIEERVERGGLSTRDDELPIGRELGELVAAVQDLRVPIEELKGVAETIDDALRAVYLADTAKVLAINVEQPANIAAKQAFEAEAGEYQQALAEAAAAAAGGAA